MVPCGPLGSIWGVGFGGAPIGERALHFLAKTLGDDVASASSSA